MLGAVKQPEPEIEMLIVYYEKVSEKHWSRRKTCFYCRWLDLNSNLLGIWRRHFYHCLETGCKYLLTFSHWHLQVSVADAVQVALSVQSARLEPRDSGRHPVATGNDGKSCIDDPPLDPWIDESLLRSARRWRRPRLAVQLHPNNDKGQPRCQRSGRFKVVW